MKNSNSNPHSSLPGSDDISRVELSNGITVLARANFNSPSIVVSGYLPGGSMFDPLDKLGLAHFTSISLMRGTQKHSFQELYGEIESVGASLGFGASVHNVSVGGRALAEDLSLLLNMMKESLRHPTFPLEYIERLRAQLLAGLAIRAQDTGDMASLTFDNLLFPNHPYGRPEDGYAETIQAITREDLINFHTAHYGPRGMVLVIVGGVEPAQAIDEVRQTLEDWVNPVQEETPELPYLRKITESVRQHVSIAGKSQCDLVMGCQGPQRRSPDYLPASLGNSILGQFGMMGRIGDVVREQAGLAYYASTSLNGWISGGSWEVSAGINPSNLERAIELITSELRRFASEPVTTEELDDSQANFVGRLPLSMESNNGVANALLNLERFQLGLDYYRQYPDLINAVTIEQILEVSRRYLDVDHLVTISAGTLSA
jgi:zinc protease